MTSSASPEEVIPQHPLWLSTVLSLFPGFALGMFIVAVAPLLEAVDVDPVFALFGGIGLVIVPLELGVLTVAARRTKGSWSPVAAVNYRARIPAKRLLPIAAGCAAWFIVTLVAWSALAEGWVVARIAPWVPDTILRFAHVDTGSDVPSVATLAAFLLIAFAFNGLIGPVTEELYFRGYLLPRMERYGRWAPVLSTVLFAVYHVWTPWRWIQIVIGFLPLAFAVRRTESIFVAIVAHVTINVLFLLMLASSFIGA